MRRKFAILALSPGLLVLGACDPEDFRFSRFSSDFHYSYPLQNGGKLSIETFNGSVDVIGWDQEMVEIDGTKHAPTQREADELAIDVDHAPDAVHIRLSRPPDFHGSRGARFSVKMPRKAILEHVTSSNGSIVVEAVLGPAHLRTTNAAIRVRGFDGGLDAQTSNSGIELADVSGETIARTSNARISVLHLKGGLEARTSNSGITANLSEAQPASSVHLETSNGGVELTLPANFASGARVRTSNGQIRLLMPQGANARVVAHTNNSAISSEFEMKVLGEVGRNNLDAVIGAGGPLLDLNTSNAAIRLLKL
jgi:DUF4097 and DUF4098 domain-containing protein YvlB